MRFMADPTSAPDTASIAPSPEATQVATPVETVTSPAVSVETPSPTVDAAPVIETVLGADTPEAVPVVEGDTSKDTPKTETPAEAKDAPKDEVKTEDIKPDVKAEEVKPEQAKTDEPKPEQVVPTYEPFVLPEGIKMDDTRMGEFTSMLGNFENISKADHTQVQKFGQALVDYHVAHVNDAVAQLTTAYTKIWEDQKKTWRDQFEKDPEIGGNRKDTTVAAANNFIRTHGGSEEQQKEFRQVLEKTGLGNHPAIIRILANAGISKNHNEGTPLPAQAPAPTKMSKLDRMYGKRNK